MRAESQKYIERLKSCKTLSEKKSINDEFSLYYSKLDENDKNDLNPYFDDLKKAINQKIENLDILASKAENILSKFQIAEV
ncbi:hypothetical protein GCM10027035_18820 [Emticicia sediminis]